MKIALTGATGFLGKPALELLLAHGHEVMAISRQPEPPELPPRRRNRPRSTSRAHRKPMSDFQARAGIGLESYTSAGVSWAGT